MAARLAHKFALAAPRVSADVVQVEDFPELAQSYEIRVVPTTLVNQTVRFEGALPEEQFLDQVLKAVEPQT